MARKGRIEYAGAHYHVMSRGNRSDRIYLDDADRKRFLETLGTAAERTGWRVHAYVLMPNHYHLLLETPQPNLVAGMKWLNGTYTQRFNARHKVWGHLLQGRYKAIVVDGQSKNYFSVVANYIHLNPARARLLGRGKRLRDYTWSSFPAYTQKRLRPHWLATEAVLGTLGYRDDASGRRAYGGYVERRVEEERGRTWGQHDAVYGGLRRGWYFGDAGFRDALTERLEKSRGNTAYDADGAMRHDHAEKRAEKLLAAGLITFGLTESDLRRLPKNHPAKRLIGAAIRKETLVSLAWIGEHLEMGVPSRVSLLCSSVEDLLSDTALSGAYKRLMEA